MPSTAQPKAPRRRTRLLFVLLAVSGFMVVSFLVVGSALPSIQHDLMVAQHGGGHDHDENIVHMSARKPWDVVRRRGRRKGLREWIRDEAHPPRVSVVFIEGTGWERGVEGMKGERVHFVVVKNMGENFSKPSSITVPADVVDVADKTNFSAIFEAVRGVLKDYFIIAWDGAMYHNDILHNMAALNENITACAISSESGELISHGLWVAEGKSEPVIISRYAGYPLYDTRASRTTTAPSADKHCMLLNTAFIESSSLALSSPNTAHLSLSLSSETPIVVLGSHFGYATIPESVSIRPDTPLSAFPKRFREYWTERLTEKYLRHDLNVVWDTFCVKCFGFTNEVMHFVEPLEGMVGVKVEQGEGCFCPGTPVSFSASLRRLHLEKGWGKDFRNRSRWEGGKRVVVWVAHKDPGSISKPKKLGRRPDWVVARSMYEFTKVDPAWVPNVNDDALIDEVWVPSAFVWSVFAANGMKKQKLTVVPEPVDVHFYDPKTTPPHPYSPTPTYRFLSVFKLEPRKGWDVLLEAYFAAFTPRDDVSLVLVCYLWGVSDSRNPKAVMKKIQEKAEELGYPASEQPHIEVVTEELTERQMASLYKACDAFVLPTKGEGWGLPIIQAMAMGMPAVATNWSGNVDFMKDDNSFPIKVDRLEELPSDSMYGAARGKVWAVPSTSHLTTILKSLQADPAMGRSVGEKARRHIVENYSDEVIAKVVEGRLKVIQEKVLRRRKKGGGGGGKKPTLALIGP